MYHGKLARLDRIAYLLLGCRRGANPTGRNQGGQDGEAKYPHACRIIRAKRPWLNVQPLISRIATVEAAVSAARLQRLQAAAVGFTWTFGCPRRNLDFGVTFHLDCSCVC